jgi:hypothetical protein
MVEMSKSMTLKSGATAFWRSTGSLLRVLPIQRVVRGLKRRGVDLSSRHGLDVYGGTGFRTTRHYAPLLRSLEVWEINPNFEAALRRNVPGAHIKTTDSYEELKRTDRRYSYIVLDSPLEKHGGHTEHFDVFPDIFRVMDDDCVLVIHVFPEADPRTLDNPDYKRLGLFDEEHLARRRSFYKTDHSEKMTLEQLAAHYRGLLEKNDFTPEWHFYVRRWELRHYIPLPISNYYLVVKTRHTRRSSPS